MVRIFLFPKCDGIFQNNFFFFFSEKDCSINVFNDGDNVCFSIENANIAQWEFLWFRLYQFYLYYQIIHNIFIVIHEYPPSRDKIKFSDLKCRI